LVVHLEAIMKARLLAVAVLLALGSAFVVAVSSSTPVAADNKTN
jgi:hypothetical protein